MAWLVGGLFVKGCENWWKEALRERIIGSQKIHTQLIPMEDIQAWCCLRCASCKALSLFASESSTAGHDSSKEDCVIMDWSVVITWVGLGLGALEPHELSILSMCQLDLESQLVQDNSPIQHSGYDTTGSGKVAAAGLEDGAFTMSKVLLFILNSALLNFIRKTQISLEATYKPSRHSGQSHQGCSVYQDPARHTWSRAMCSQTLEEHSQLLVKAPAVLEVHSECYDIWLTGYIHSGAAETSPGLRKLSRAAETLYRWSIWPQRVLERNQRSTWRLWLGDLTDALGGHCGRKIHSSPPLPFSLEGGTWRRV